MPSPLTGAMEGITTWLGGEPIRGLIVDSLFGGGHAQDEVGLPQAGCRREGWGESREGRYGRRPRGNGPRSLSPAGIMARPP